MNPELMAEFDFGDALYHLTNEGDKVARKEWVDSKDYLEMGSYLFRGTEVIAIILVHFDPRFKKETRIVWLPNQKDILAKDWYLVEIKK